MNITPNFKLQEFNCKDGTGYPPEWVSSKLKPLCQALERIRVEFANAPITITSGYRTEKYNKQVGGAKSSKHCEGIAVDFKVKGINPRMVHEVCENLIKKKQIPEGGLGLYNTWVHYDIRGHRARWGS